jgi:hypothetical protein
MGLTGRPGRPGATPEAGVAPRRRPFHAFWAGGGPGRRKRGANGQKRPQNGVYSTLCVSGEEALSVTGHDSQIVLYPRGEFCF